MKKFRKLLSLVLAMVMVLAMAAPSFAEEQTGSITIENAKSSDGYKAYKIFDVVYNTDKSAYAYTIAKNSPWYTVVSEYATESDVGIELVDVPGDSTIANVVVDDDVFNASDFSATLRNKLDSVSDNGYSFAEVNGAIVCNNLPLGYYFVKSTTGALCNLTTINPNVNIKDKNDVPFTKTADTEGGSVEVGQIITYTIMGKVPDTTGFTEYKYDISDTMTAGLTFNRDVKVTIDGEALSTEGIITYETNGFKLSINVIDLQEKKNADIVVTYTATVNENAVTVISENEAILEYGNGDNIGETSTKVENYTSKLVIDKYKEGNSGIKLANAKFVLYKEVTVDSEGDAEPAIVKKYYKYDDNAVTWVDNIEDATYKTTDQNGAAEFVGLEDGKDYYLLETEAPEGYNLLDEALKVEINGSASLDPEANVAAVLTQTALVGNSVGAILPSTGGIGTTVFYAVGIVLMAGAVFFVVRRKRA